MVVADTVGEVGDERREPTTTLAGWQRFVNAAPATLTCFQAPHGQA